MLGVSCTRSYGSSSVRCPNCDVSCLAVTIPRLILAGLAQQIPQKGRRVDGRMMMDGFCWDWLKQGAIK